MIASQSTHKILPYPYQKRPVIIKAEDDSTEESLLFRKGKGIIEKGRAHSANDAYRPRGATQQQQQQKQQHPADYRIPKEIVTGPGTQSDDFENNLSTTGQELYIVDGRDINRDLQDPSKGPQNIPQWSELGIVEETDDTIPVFDEDVEWLLSAKEYEYQDYYNQSLQEPKDLLLKVATPIRTSSPVLDPVGISPEPVQQEKPPQQPIQELVVDVNAGKVEEKPKGSKPASPTGRLTPDPGSPKYQKYYSWYQYRSPPRSPGSLRRDSKVGIVPKPGKESDSLKRDQVSTIDQSASVNKKQKKKNELIATAVEPTGDLTVLLSKSMPVFPSSVDSSSLKQGSTSQEGSKRSLQGLTHMMFEGAYTDSPYIEHLTKPNHALIALQNPMFANKPGMKGLNLNTSITASAAAARKKSMKNYAIIKDDVNKLVMSSSMNLPPPSTTKFPPIIKQHLAGGPKSKKLATMKFNSNTLLEHVYERPDDLYVKSKQMAQQLQQQFTGGAGGGGVFIGSDRSRARLMNKQGISQYPINDTETDGMNFINSHPTSPAILRTLSPSTLHDQQQGGVQTKYTNNIDQLITTMNTSVTSFKNNNHAVAASSPPIIFDSSGRISPTILNHSSSIVIGNSSVEETEGQVDAMDMLANIHIDPLYRIIRDEIETLLFKPAPATTNNAIALQSTTNFAFNANNIKIMSNFQSLPPSAWVICRIVYFIIMNYYEHIMMKPDYYEYRKLTQLEPIWKILDRHYQQEGLNSLTIHKIFSWPYLQELMLTSNNHFVKLLDIIEYGVQLTSPQWKLFNETVKKAHFQQRLQRQNGGATGDQSGAGGVGGETDIPEERITNNERSRNLFYNLFPISALAPLRTMVKAAKVFLMRGGSNGIGGSTIGMPAGMSSATIPGSPLIITVTMTSWLKRIIALIYVSTTQRLKEMKVSQPLFMSLQDVETTAGEGPTAGQLSEATTERITVVAPPVDTVAVMNKVLIQQNHHYPSRLFCLLILHHPSSHRFPANEGRQQHLQELISNNIGGGTVESPVLRGVPAYFQISSALIRPSDELQVIIMKPVTNASDYSNIYSHDSYDENERSGNRKSGGDRHDDEYSMMKKDIQKHLRITSASPLHTVAIVPMENYYLLKQRVSHSAQQQQQLQLQQPNQSSDGAISLSSPGVMIQDCFVLHDGLSYGLQLIFPDLFPVQTTATNQTERSKLASSQSPVRTVVPHLSTSLKASKNVDLLLTEFHIGKKNHPLIKVKKSNNYSTEMQFKAEEELKERLVFSLGLISDSMSVNSGHVTRARGNRYVVCVTDSMNSWNAFEMTKKVAKESDSIYLYHSPILPYWELRNLMKELSLQAPPPTADGVRPANDQFQSSPERQESDYQRSSLTFNQYQLLVQQLQHRKEKIIALYRNMGYNVLIGPVEEYFEMVQRLMKNYSLMLRYNSALHEQQLAEQQQQSENKYFPGYEDGGGEEEKKTNESLEQLLPFERYIYFQYNEEIKHYSRQLLLSIASLEADYVVIGADNEDIYYTLSNYYENSFFHFEAHRLEEFTYEIHYHPMIAASSSLPPQLIQIPTATSRSALISELDASKDEYDPLSERREIGRGDDGHSHYYLPAGDSNNHENDQRTITNVPTNDSTGTGLFEEKAIMLDDLDNTGRKGRREGGGGGDSLEGDDYEEDWSDERSNSKLNKGQLPPILTNVEDANNDQNNSANNEYDLDSFIVEDNDEEGVDSLTASPYMMDHHHITHAYELEREQLQHKGNPSSASAAATTATPLPSIPIVLEERRKEVIRRKVPFHKKHLKYYRQYSEQPISFINMLLHQAMTIDQWADESNQSISETVISPILPGGASSAFSPTRGYKNNTHNASQNSNNNINNKKGEKTPLGFFSFILANSPFIARDHHHNQSNQNGQSQQNHDHSNR